MSNPLATIERYKQRQGKKNLSTMDVLNIAVDRLNALTEDTRISIRTCYSTGSINRVDAAELMSRAGIHRDLIEATLSNVDKEKQA